MLAFSSAGIILGMDSDSEKRHLSLAELMPGAHAQNGLCSAFSLQHNRMCLNIKSDHRAPRGRYMGVYFST